MPEDPLIAVMFVFNVGARFVVMVRSPITNKVRVMVIAMGFATAANTVDRLSIGPSPVGTHFSASGKSQGASETWVRCGILSVSAGQGARDRSRRARNIVPNSGMDGEVPFRRAMSGAVWAMSGAVWMYER